MEVRRRSSAGKEPDGPILADGQESFKNLQKLLRSLSFVHLVENSLLSNYAWTIIQLNHHNTAFMIHLNFLNNFGGKTGRKPKEMHPPPPQHIFLKTPSLMV